MIVRECSSDEERHSAVSINRQWRATMRSYFGRGGSEPQVELPRQPEPVPMAPREIKEHPMLGSPYAPPQRHAVSRSNAAAELVAQVDQMAAELDVMRTANQQLADDVRRKDGEIERLQLEISQAKNDFQNALTTTQKAVHAATDYRGLVSNIRAAVIAMIDQFEIGDAVPIAPSAARKVRPRLEKKNGEPAPVVSEDPKIEHPAVTFDGSEQNQKRE